MKKQLLCWLSLIWLASCSPSADELFQEGIRHLEESDYQKAITYFDRAIDKQADFTSALNAKGIALIQLAQYDRAIETLNRSIKIDSLSYKPYYNRGNAWFEKGEYRAAVMDYNTANGLEPGVLDIYFNRGVALMGMEEYEDAIFDFEILIQENPEHPRAWFNKGKSEFWNNDPVSSINSLTRAVDLDNSNGEAYYLIGTIQMSAFNMVDEGCVSFKMARSLGYADAQTWIDDFCKE
ncbi:tetratricopeptide repeat protein [Mongoliitalea daihaiensis]|uniref:tetratricopeptide repeat protein n=1 Tax=Mongoliitalea daihaiensis TaxID=2782006 RepID=UPI001F1ABB25|nr:tetratricopeptide repeat protein [Mongoliitalea daihaiensis]